MRQLAPVQLLTWLGLFCMWLYFPVAVAHNVFGAADEKSAPSTPRESSGQASVFMYSVVMFVFSFFLVSLVARASRKRIAQFACSAALPDCSPLPYPQ